MMKRVLVAGATGYLGGFVAREFKARGFFVRGLTRSPGKLDHLKDCLDEVVVAEVTRPETLNGICRGMDIVFSSVGITRQRDGLTFRDVDYRGNRNLLTAALLAGVKKFVYVSVFQGPKLLNLDIVKAHEDFVAVLRESGIDYSVVRPNGFFSDMEEYLTMARKGHVWLFGSGRNRINPIHGADLAVTCVDAVEPGPREIDVGGPEVLTHREIAELSLDALGKPPRISSVPLWAARLMARIVRLFNRHQGVLLAFITNAMSADAVAPATGHRRLEDHFKALAGSEEAGGRVDTSREVSDP